MSWVQYICYEQSLKKQQHRKTSRRKKISFTRKIETRLSFSKGNVSGGIKTRWSSRRKDFPFRPFLGKDLKRSGNFRNSKGIQNFLVTDTSLGRNSPEYNPKKTPEISCGKRAQRNIKEGSNKESLTTQRSARSKSISEQFFSFREKRWW